MKNLILGLLILALFTSVALADVPDKFTNLKIFPEDIGKRELIDAMRSFSMALGMRCTGCHEIKTPGDYDSIDWASDKPHDKEITRGMMRMTQEINSKLLPAATGEHDFSVRCVTCHRGVENPRTLDNVLLKVIGKDGVDAGLTKYRELREIYYGSGSYDFTPTTLTTVAETLAQESTDIAGARLLINLNLEMNPDHADSYLMLAQMDIAAGDKDAARVNIEKALEIAPNSGHGKRMLQQLDQ